MKQLDFYASQVQYYDHMLPIWEALPNNAKGEFMVSSEVKSLRPHKDTKDGMPKGVLTLVAGWGDYHDIKGDVVYMEHGIGHVYRNSHDQIHVGYAGSIDKDRVVLFLNQHEVTQKGNLKVYPKTRNEIIGTPKMDIYDTQQVKGRVVCISFHWDCRVSPESRSAFYYYADEVKRLIDHANYDIIFHGHPRLFGTWQHEIKKYFKQSIKARRTKFIDNFDDVLKIADVYVNDNSSTMFEFALLDKPVVVLNCPFYRRDCIPGIRFWDYIPGIQVDDPKDLNEAIVRTLDNPNEYAKQRATMRKALYPYWHESSKRASEVIMEYLECT